jgi:integrase
MAWAEPAGKDRWRGRYYAKVDGARVPRTAGYATTKQKAKKLGLDEEAKIRNGSWFNVDAGKVTFSEYFEHLWLPNRGGELNTKSNYRSQYNAKQYGLKVSFGDAQLRHITNSVVQGWVAKMIAAEMSASTIEARFVTLQTVLASHKGASAVRDRLIQTNPCLGVQIPKRSKKKVEIYDPEQVETLLDHLDPWWVPIPMLDAETGMRWGELMGLKVKDFTPGFRSVRVERVVLELTKAETGNGTRFLIKEYPKEGEGESEKFVALHRDAQTLVQSVVTSRALGPEDHLFSMPDKVCPPEWHPPLSLVWEPLRTDVWPHGLPISRNFFRESIWKPAIAAAGLPARKFHALRASNISWLLSGGLELPAVMKRVGHTQYATTWRYTAVMEDADTRAIQAMDNVKGRYRDRRRV